ncbi:hypothetical protein ACJX0J_034850, partial [Zea mays]
MHQLVVVLVLVVLVVLVVTVILNKYSHNILVVAVVVAYFLYNLFPYIFGDPQILKEVSHMGKALTTIEGPGTSLTVAVDVAADMLGVPPVHTTEEQPAIIGDQSMTGAVDSTQTLQPTSEETTIEIIVTSN